MLTLVLGGARSGKSRFAQSLCDPTRRVAYLATATAEDEEMQARIARHRLERPSALTTLEEPVGIAKVVDQQASFFDVIILDCLTLWLSNWCWEYRSHSPERLELSVLEEIERLSTAARKSHLIAVSNEVGCGIVPQAALGRQFRDLQGIVNQRVAGEAQTVYQMVAGIPVLIKQRNGASVS
jgi:adenosylcobinamide kinase/adenosylcobinamide-phosphate guanylyltransferase